MAEMELIERGSNRETFADRANARRRTASMYTRRLFVAHPVTRGFVPFVSDNRPAEGGRRINTPGLNLQAREGRMSEGAADWDLYSEDFTRKMGRAGVVLEENISGTWTRVELQMLAGVEKAAGGRTESYLGVDWAFIGTGVSMLVDIEQEQGVPKLQATVQNLSAGTRIFRVVMGIRFDQDPESPKPIFASMISGSNYTSRAVGLRWSWPNGENFDFDWSDMIRSGAFGRAQQAPNGVNVFSPAMPMAPGESRTVDPTFSRNADTGGQGAAADSAWGFDASNGNSQALGSVGGAFDIVSWYRWDISSITGYSSIDAARHYAYNKALGVGTVNPATLGPFNGTGQGNPATGSYAAAYLAAQVYTNNYTYLGSVNYSATGAQTLTLPSQALTDINAAIPGGAFTLVNQRNGLSGNNYTFLTAYNTSNGNPARLEVDYTTGGGGGIFPLIGGPSYPLNTRLVVC
jgi:hypothetical protein